MSLELDEGWVKYERDLYWRLLELDDHEHEDVATYVEEALGLLVKIVHAAAGYLELRDPLDPSDPARRWTAVRGPLLQSVDDIRAVISDHAIALTLEQGKTVVTGCASEDQRFAEDESGQRLGVAILCVPVGSPPIGVVYLQAADSGFPSYRAQRVSELFARKLPRAAAAHLLRVRCEGVDHTRAIRGRFKADELVGVSRALARVLDEAAMVAPLDDCVLLTGPTGTGKTALARVIANNSPRARGPFVRLNCAGLPEFLFESELFGARRGAHSTALNDVEGKVCAAEGGTLFLDDISELSPGSQAKLLQLVESKEYYPLGSTELRRADVRILAASNAELAELVAQKRFREDLYYRLSGLPIAMPALSERREDIAVLCRFFCERSCARRKVAPMAVVPWALLRATDTEWPGNVRELGHAIQRAVHRALYAGSEVVHAHHLFDEALPGDQPRNCTLRSEIEDTRRRRIVEALEACDGNVTHAAKRLGLSRTTVYRDMERLDIDRPNEPVGQQAVQNPRKSRTRLTKAGARETRKSRSSG